MHILDLLITRKNDLKTYVSDPGLSDHSAVFCDLSLTKPPCPKVISNCRNVKNISFQEFSKDILSLDFISGTSDLDVLVERYESQLSTILDKHAPVQTRVVTVRPSSPWYTDGIKAEKVKRRKLERRWRKTKSTVDHEIFKTQCKVVQNLINTSRKEFYSGVISDNESNQRILFSTFDKLIHKNAPPLYPSSFSSANLANSFSDLFVNKIKNIQDGFPCDSIPDEPVTVLSAISQFSKKLNVIVFQSLSRL